MEGEDGDSDNPRAFGRASVWKRLIILVAGSAMNLLIGFLIALIFTASYYNQDYIPGTTLSAISSESAYLAGGELQAGDQLYSIDGERIYILNDFSMMMERNETQHYDFVVLRDGETVELKDFELKLVELDGQMRYGLTFQAEEKSIGTVFSYAYHLSRDFARLVRLGLEDLLTGNTGISDMGGPVVIVETVVQSSLAADESEAGLGLLNTLYYFAFIAINLAVMNLLPIPALDGGRAVCLLVTAAAEKILRRKINPKYEGYLHGIFMLLLLAFMAIITFKDIFHLFGG